MLYITILNITSSLKSYLKTNKYDPCHICCSAPSSIQYIIWVGFKQQFWIYAASNFTISDIQTHDEYRRI